MAILRYLLPFVTFCFCTGTTVQKRALKNPYLQNFIYDSDLLFEHTAWSKLDCARRCAGTSGSVTFTFSKQDGRCRCHCSALSSTGITSSPAPGTHVFEFQQAAGNWLSASCSSNCNCKVPGSECFFGKCLCTPGYYYSLSKNNCVPSCLENDLNSTMQSYSAFFYFDTTQDLADGISGRTAAECSAWCVGWPRCRLAASYNDFECHLYGLGNAEHTRPINAGYPDSVSFIKSCV